MFNGSDGFAMDLVFPVGHAVALDSHQVLEWFRELGGVGDIITIESNKTREMLDLLSVLGVVKVNDGLNFLRVRCTTGGHNEVS
jgi:hypothetical protein